MGSLYVTDLGKTASTNTKDGDGAIAEVNEKWELESKNILAGLSNAKIDAPGGITSFNYRNKSTGFSMLRKAIAVTDIDKVYAYELLYKSRVFYLDLSAESKSLAGIVALNDSILLVAATDINAIFKININTKFYEKSPLPKIKAPKGLCLDKEKKNVYCVGWGDKNSGGEIWRIGFAGMSVEKIGDDLGLLGGCAVYDNRLYFSDWVEPAAKKGVIRFIDLKSHALGNLSNVEAIGGPGQLYIDELSKTLLVPAALEGVVYRIPLE
jgi:hypothetical protein